MEKFNVNESAHSLNTWGSPKPSPRPRKQISRKKVGIIAAIGIVILLLIIIPTSVVVSRNNRNKALQNADGNADSDSDRAGLNSTGTGNSITNSITSNTPTRTVSSSTSTSSTSSAIPSAYRGTLLDTATWYETTDFNTTFTTETVGNLSIMGLNSTWDDSKRANENVPPLSSPFPYGTQPIKGVNLGGWLVLEPFITPSYFETYDPSQGVIDEYTLCAALGTQASSFMDKHYATFITLEAFQNIASYGLDHVRIPYGYWAVQNQPGDSFVEGVSWRYLLRAIEYARMFGLRVNLDLHSVPGGQNGWNHSGRQGVLNWLNGTPQGQVYGQDTLDLHKQLATFFAQDRYKNIVTLYGLVNEPNLMSLTPQTVIDWTEQAYNVVRQAGMDDAYIVFGDGFHGLTAWAGVFPEATYPRMILDAHQYMIFNEQMVAFTHQAKLGLACGWTGLIESSVNPATGHGPTIVAEFSTADTDCAEYLNNVNNNQARWARLCTAPPCDCTVPNSNTTSYPPQYGDFLLDLVEKQMTAFEVGWGWFFWTYDTETNPQWSYKKGVEGGILPAKAYTLSTNCDNPTANAYTGLSESI